MKKFLALVLVLFTASCVSFGGVPSSSDLSGVMSSSSSSSAPRAGSLPIIKWAGDLAGSTNASQTVAGIKGIMVPTPTGTNTVLTYNLGAFSWGAGGGGSVTWANDLAGSTSTNQYVAAISGNGGLGGTIPINASALQAGTAISAFTLGTNKAGATLTLQADAATAFLTGKVNGNSMETDWADKTGATQDVLGINAVAGVIQHSSPNAFEYVWTVGAGPSSELILGTGADQLEYATGQSFQILNNSASQVALFNDNGTALGKTTGNNSFIGSAQYTTRTVTSSFTVDTTTTDRTIWANTSGGAFTVTLPAPTAGRELIFVDSGHSWATNHLTIARHGTETINTVAANLSVVAGSGVSGVDEICRVVSDGTNWQSDCK